MPMTSATSPILYRVGGAVGTTSSFLITQSTSTTGSVYFQFNNTGSIWTSATTFATSSTQLVSWYTAGQLGGYVEQTFVPPSERQLREHERLKSIKIHRAKSSIKRALKLMDNVGLGGDVKVFLGGQEIEVSHPDSLFKFVIKRPRSIIDRTVNPGYSTPYSLSLFTKSNVHIADLCVYMKNTPVLDQVLALSMYIKSGSEDLILAQANWSKLTKDVEACEILSLEYPPLRSKLKPERLIYQH